MTITEKMEMTREYLTEVGVSKITKRAVQTLRNDRCKGTGIPYVKLARSVRYDLADVIAYMEARKIQTEDTAGVATE